MRSFVRLEWLLQFLFVVLLLVGMFSFAMFQGDFVSWFIFFTVTPFLLYSFLLAIMPIRIVKMERQIQSQRLQRGDDVMVTVTVELKTWLPLMFVTMQDCVSEKAKEKKGHFVFGGLKRKFSWHYTLHSLERGMYEFHHVHVKVTDLFGWVTRHLYVEERQSFIVYPKVVALNYVAMQSLYEQGTRAKFVRMKDPTVVTGVRNYEPGDRFSTVHWKSFAKTGELRTKEFEVSQSQHVNICLDSSTKRHFEKSIELTASLLEAAVKQRADVSFACQGNQAIVFPHIRSMQQLQQVMYQLSTIQSNGEWSFILQQVQQAKQGTTTIIVTGELSEQLEQLVQEQVTRNRHIVCFVLSEKDERTPNLNHRILFLPEDCYAEAFAEVMQR